MLEIPMTIFADRYDAVQLRLNLQYFHRMVPSLLHNRLHVIANISVVNMAETSYNHNVPLAYQEFCRAFVPALELTCMTPESYEAPIELNKWVMDKFAPPGGQFVSCKELMFNSYTMMGNPLFANLLYPVSYYAKNFTVDGAPVIIELEPSDFNLSVSMKNSVSRDVVKNRGGAGLWMFDNRFWTTTAPTGYNPQYMREGVVDTVISRRGGAAPGITKSSRRANGPRFYKFTRYETPEVGALTAKGSRIPPTVGSLSEKPDGNFDPTKTMLYEHLREVQRHEDSFYVRTVIYSLGVLCRLYPEIHQALSYRVPSQARSVVVPKLWLERSIAESVDINTVSTGALISTLTHLLNTTFDRVDNYGLSFNKNIATSHSIRRSESWWNKVTLQERGEQKSLHYMPSLVEGGSAGSVLNFRPKSDLLFSIERGLPLYILRREDGDNETIPDAAPRHLSRYGAANNMSTYHEEQLTLLYQDDEDTRIANRSDMQSITSPRGILNRVLESIRDQCAENSFYRNHLEGKVFGANLILSLPSKVGRVINRSYVYYTGGVTLEVHLMNPAVTVFENGISGFAVVHSVSDGYSRLFYF